jgi:hypothetical protein
MEVHAHVEENHQALEQDEGSECPRREALYALGSLQRPPYEASRPDA